MAGLLNTLHRMAALAAFSLLASSTLSSGVAWAQDAPSIAQLEERAAAGDAEAIKKLGEALLKGGKAPGDAEKGVKLLEQAISLGRADAMLALGTAYLWGNGVAVNATRAEELLNRAASSGHAGARRTLGEQYVTGWVLAQNSERGLALIEEGIAAGDVASKGILGRLLLEGKYLPADKDRGLSLLEEAIRAKDINALTSLGLAYLRGTGVAADPVKARDLLAQAAASGDNAARRQLGEALVAGRGVEKDAKEGLRLLEDAVQASDKRAHVTLGQLLLDGEYLKPNRKRATEVLLALDKLTQTGEGSELLGSMILKTATSKRDLTLAENHLRSAGQAGRGTAWFALARAALRGKLAGNSARKYRDYAERARKAGVEGIAVVEAERYQWGFGTRANGQKAVDILTGAAEAGNKQAVRYLVKVTRDGDGWKIKPNRKAAGRYLERYGEVLSPAERSSMSLLIRASRQRSSEALEALSAEISGADVAKSVAFQRELFATNPNLSVYLLQQKLKSQQIYNGPMSGMFTKPMLRAIKEACDQQTSPARCGGNLMSVDTVSALLSQ